MPKFGFDDAAWEAAKVEWRDALAARAHERRMIPYSDFVKWVRSISFEGAICQQDSQRDSAGPLADKRWC